MNTKRNILAALIIGSAVVASLAFFTTREKSVGTAFEESTVELSRSDIEGIASSEPEKADASATTSSEREGAELGISEARNLHCLVVRSQVARGMAVTPEIERVVASCAEASDSDFINSLNQLERVASLGDSSAKHAYAQALAAFGTDPVIRSRNSAFVSQKAQIAMGWMLNEARVGSRDAIQWVVDQTASTNATALVESDPRTYDVFSMAGLTLLGNASPRDVVIRNVETNRRLGLRTYTDREIELLVAEVEAIVRASRAR